MPTFRLKRQREELSSSEDAYIRSPDSTYSPSGSGSQHNREQRVMGSYQEDEENDELITQEYRCGGPLLCKIPGRMMPLESSSPVGVAWNEGLKDGVLEALYEQGVQWTEVIIVGRGARSAPDADCVSTILVITKLPATNKSSWYRAFAEIRSLCIQRDVGDLNIEITDPKGMKLPPIYPVGPSDVIVQRWPRLKHQILSILQDHKWQSVDVVKTGWHDIPDMNPTTIMITVAAASPKDWDVISKHIIDLVDRSGPEPLHNVAVQISRDEPEASNGLQVAYSRDQAIRLALRTEATLGASMYRDDDNSSAGTLGGFVELKDPSSGKWTMYGLTCYHCVAPENLWRKNSQGNDIISSLERQGKPPFNM
jgi:hypothetical protein